MKKIKIIFLFFLFWNLVLAFYNIEIYPSIKFPHFYCRNYRKEIKFYKLDLRDKNDKVIDLSEIVRPYDKRFVLFGLRSLIDSSTRYRSQVFFNQKSLWKKKIYKIEVGEIKIKLPE
jgi:hypothetical protein